MLPGTAARLGVQLPWASSEPGVASLTERPLVAAPIRHVPCPVRLLVTEHQEGGEHAPVSTGRLDHL